MSPYKLSYPAKKKLNVKIKLIKSCEERTKCAAVTLNDISFLMFANALSSAQEYLCFVLKIHYHCFNEESQRTCPCVKVHTDSLKHSDYSPFSPALSDYI